MPIATTGISHLRLTVTDIARSRAFYEEVLGFHVALAAPPADAPQEEQDDAWFLFGGVIFQTNGLLFGLRPVADAGDRFDEDRVGLDHLAFAVADRSVLEDAVELLDQRGVAHEGIKDAGSMWILEFRDPDNNALELSVSKPR
jgi:glyoxylase I family protein